jgi:hypothetical protein
MTDVTHTTLEQLLGAYRATLYRVWAPGAELLLRVDQHEPKLTKLFREAWVEGAALLTAWNPGSVSRPLHVNQSRQQALERELRAAGCACLRARNEPGVDSATREQWSEEAVLALGITLEKAQELAICHEQLAFLWIGTDATPRLMTTTTHGRGVSNLRD